MKKTILFALLAAAAASCQNKTLHDRSNVPGVDVGVRIYWRTGLTIPYTNGMRINLFSLTAGVADYGRADVRWDGGTVRLRQDASYITYAYNYVGNNVLFRNETDPVLIEASSPALTRATYSRAFPDEPTVGGITGDLHLGVNPAYTVSGSGEAQFIDVHPESIAFTYTYEIRGITGAQFIRAARGGISGFSASRFLATGSLSSTASTLLFENSQVNTDAGTITGSFRTFGRLDTSNHFTIEILFPSNTPGGGILQETWDVTAQIAGGTNFHILISNAAIDIPDEGGEEAGGWKVDLGDWNDVTVPLN